MNPPPSASPESQCPRCGSTMVRDGICQACVLSSVLGGGAAESFPAAPPARVGDYELIEELARGGMGVVWRARQRRLQREVALKFVLEGVLPGETVARRFRQEAEVAAQLSHPHIISVYEVGEADGRYFISMELAAGGTLAQRLQQGKFAPRAAAELAARLARAVQHAHDRGVLHRDLKPGNVLFDAAGEPRISDFGLARLTRDRSALTQTGAVMGTPSYMAPEQARGESSTLTTASDVYGLGAILYEMLAGHAAFAGEVPVEVLRRVLDEEPAALTGIERDLETVCLKCLRKDPAERYLSAGAVADDLERWVRGEPIEARRASMPERVWKWVRRRPVLAALWGALLAAAVVIAGLILTSRVELARARGAAEASGTESRHRRADQHTTAAILAIERGDSLRALPSLAAAIRIGTGDETRDRVNRIRYGSILRLAPVLQQAWYPAWVSDVKLVEESGCVAVSDGPLVRLLSMSDGGPAGYPIWCDYSPKLTVIPATGRLLVQDSGWITAWDTVSGRQLARVPGKFVRSPLLFPGSEKRLALSYGGVVRRWSAASLKYDGPELMHPEAVRWAWLCRDGETVVTLARDGVLRVWDAGLAVQRGKGLVCPEGTEFLTERPAEGAVQLKVGGDAGMMVDLASGESRGGEIPAGDIRACGLVGTELAQARVTREGFVVSDSVYGNTFATAMHGAHGNDVGFTRDGSFVFTRSVDSAARLWIAREGRPATPYLWQGADPLYHDLSATGEYILVSNRAPEVKLWRVRRWNGAASESRLTAAEERGEWLRSQARAANRALTRSFRREAGGGRPALLTEVRDDILHVRRTTEAGAADVLPPLPHHARIVDAQFSPDGRIIASFTTSQCVYLWDAATGKQIGPLLRHDREIESIAFSPDSSLILATGILTVRVWETASGTPASPPMVHAGAVSRAWWNGDSTVITTIDNAGRRREWNLAPDQRPAAELEQMAQVYSGHQVTNDGALAPLNLEAARRVWEEAGNSR